MTGLSLSVFVLATGLALILIGLVAISSASIEYAQINYDSTWFHTSRHLIYMLIATIGAVAMLCQRGVGRLAEPLAHLIADSQPPRETGT